MAPKKIRKTDREEHVMHGREVVISRDGARERLLIDGRPYAFSKTPGGYVLKAYVYAEPTGTLAEAVEQYLARTAPGA